MSVKNILPYALLSDKNSMIAPLVPSLSIISAVSLLPEDAPLRPSGPVMSNRLRASAAEPILTSPLFEMRNLSVNEPPEGFVNTLNPLEAPP